jgi:hypothetical protein
MKKLINAVICIVRAEVDPEFNLDGEGDRTRNAKLKITIFGLPEQPDQWSIRDLREKSGGGMGKSYAYKLIRAAKESAQCPMTT